MSFPLADAIFWIAVACCSVAQLAIIRSAIVSPARVPGSEPTSATRRIGEIAWAMLPGVALAVLFAFTWQAMRNGHVVIPDVLKPQ
jgi:heme/copper-type cytochrome/quinol oxidase subunit 2